ncbi:hypothetical protein [Modestobacter sp. KNN46-3]|uniref:Uncharacterized protein n=1 Tax=Modestobacter caceresii TaxID=1522368 RepID=A0A098Y9Z2_9ACTN|nr:hypothetical protein [Modestobacter sp. KNN46-3]KGH47257.1 hypothetical protein IN07_07605 [Modestobacter caceresii]
MCTGLTALRVGPTAALPAFLLLAVVAVLLAVVDVQHRLLPDRIVLPRARRRRSAASSCSPPAGSGAPAPCRSDRPCCSGQLWQSHSPSPDAATGSGDRNAA